MRLRLGDGADEWIYLRLTHNIPQYDDVRIGDRVRLVGPGEPADLVVREDGALVPAQLEATR